jgi:hypothetical protein
MPVTERSALQFEEDFVICGGNLLLLSRPCVGKINNLSWVAIPSGTSFYIYQFFHLLGGTGCNVQGDR